MSIAARRFALASLVLLAVPAFADKAPSPKPLTPCKGQKAGDAEARDARKAKESGAFFAFARSLLGAPVSCEMSEDEFEGQRFISVKYRFATAGAVLSLESSPPETSVQSLEILSGFKKAPEARTFLEKTAKEMGFAIDWKKAPETETREGRIESSWWDPDEGSNASARMVKTSSGALVMISISYAL